ncbi:MAG: peptidoglycan DD-metalloendopeptidase family protein [Chloroflexota bacterium]|nr:peptidoglycan DD-metalloendopeptidase family protein [Chloroflexota bacterium]
MLRRVTAWAAVLFIYLGFVAGVGAAATNRQQTVVAAKANAPVARVYAPSRQTGGVRFLTLPFNDSSIAVNQGWVYSWGSQHYGLDYVLGGPEISKLQKFDVVASADGYACGNCTSRQGNAVWIKHDVDGQTYYTYYGHLDSIESDIPVGNQRNTVFVKRGQKIGVAGSTGASTIHLHFQVNRPSGPVDPYDLWSTSEPYMPGCATCEIGADNLWTTNPPSFASGQPLSGGPAGPATRQEQTQPTAETRQEQPRQPAQPTRTATATRTPAPTATPTPIPCDLPYDSTVEGQLNGSKPQHEYCLEADAGQWISIKMFAAKDATLDTVLKLYGPDGTLLASDDDGAQIGTNSFLVARLPKKGTYKIVAAKYEGTGAYRVRMEKGAKSALGDLNGDCRIDATDTQALALALGTRDPKADLNLDGVVDDLDRQAMLLRLGRGCTGQ